MELNRNKKSPSFKIFVLNVGFFLPLSLITSFDIQCYVGSFQNWKHRASLRGCQHRAPCRPGTPPPRSCQSQGSLSRLPYGLFVLPVPGNLLQPRASRAVSSAVLLNQGVLIQVELESRQQPCVKAWFKKLKSHTISGWLGFVFHQAATMEIKVTNQKSMFGSNLKFSYWQDLNSSVLPLLTLKSKLNIIFQYLH